MGAPVIRMGLRVGGEGNGFIAGAHGGILALNGEYVFDMPFERVIFGDGFGNRAVFVDQKQDLVGTSFLRNLGVARQGQQRQPPQKRQRDEMLFPKTKTLHVPGTTAEPRPFGKRNRVGRRRGLLASAGRQSPLLFCDYRPIGMELEGKNSGATPDRAICGFSHSDFSKT
jgi:hypothetical protein